MVDPVILILLATTVASISANIMQYCYKSKCVKINCCCGLVEIQRDIQKEEEIDNHTTEIEMNDIYDDKHHHHHGHPKNYHEEPLKYNDNPQKHVIIV